MPVDFITAAAYFAGIILLLIFGRLSAEPMKILMKLVYNTIIGGLVLFLLNLAGGFIHFQIAFNVVSALVVGVLGMPGLALLVALKFLLQI